jgi:hypothetical protein
MHPTIDSCEHYGDAFEECSRLEGGNKYKATATDDIESYKYFINYND